MGFIPQLSSDVWPTFNLQLFLWVCQSRHFLIFTRHLGDDLEYFSQKPRVEYSLFRNRDQLRDCMQETVLAAEKWLFHFEQFLLNIFWLFTSCVPNGERHSEPRSAPAIPSAIWISLGWIRLVRRQRYGVRAMSIMNCHLANSLRFYAQNIHETQSKGEK